MAFPTFPRSPAPKHRGSAAVSVEIHSGRVVRGESCRCATPPLAPSQALSRHCRISRSNCLALMAPKKSSAAARPGRTAKVKGPAEAPQPEGGRWLRGAVRRGWAARTLVRKAVEEPRDVLAREAVFSVKRIDHLDLVLPFDRRAGASGGGRQTAKAAAAAGSTCGKNRAPHMTRRIPVELVHAAAGQGAELAEDHTNGGSAHERVKGTGSATTAEG